MPEFAHDLGHPDGGITYSALLAADAAGALVAGFVLESRGLLPPNPRTAFLLAMLWCIAIGAFAMSTSYPLALAILFVAGFLELSFFAMAQTLVQVNAPAAVRGRVIGLFAMAALGARAFSGVTVGLGGAVIGIHWSLALSAALLLILATHTSSARDERSKVLSRRPFCDRAAGRGASHALAGGRACRRGGEAARLPLVPQDQGRKPHLHDALRHRVESGLSFVRK
jgi:MFS family permease